MPSWLIVALFSMIPIFELRFAIPAAAIPASFMFVENPVIAYMAAVVGNILPVPFILLLIAWFLGVMKRAPVRWINRVADFIENKAQKGAAKLRHGAFIGLFLFVAIPLPLTGAWTGALIAGVFGFDKRWAFLSILAGVMVAGVIMTLAAYGVVGIFGIFL